MELGLGISGLVNKLVTFIAALADHDPSCATLEKRRQYKTEKSSEKAAIMKRRRDSSTRSVSCMHYKNLYY